MLIMPVRERALAAAIRSVFDAKGNDVMSIASNGLRSTVGL